MKILLYRSRYWQMDNKIIFYVVGVIMYSEQEGTKRGDFLSLNLVNRHLQLRFNLGGGSSNITYVDGGHCTAYHSYKLSSI